MAIRFSKLYTIGQNSRSNSTNFNGEMDNIYNSINTVDSDRSDLAGTGRTTETVKGNADALTAHKASGDHDTHNDTLYYRQSAVDSKVSDLAGAGRTTQTIKGNSDALTTHKASSDHDTHTDAMYYRQATVDSKDTTTLNSAKSYSDGNLTTHKSSSDHDTHTDAMYYRQSAVDTKVSDLAGAGRTTETIKGNYDALTTHKSSSDHDVHTDAMYYRQATVDSKINNASKTLTIASGTAFPSAPYTDGQVFWRSDLNQQFSYSGAVGAWLPSVPGNTTSHGASLNGVWHFDTDLYSTRGTAGTFTRASVANDPNTFASVASGLPRLTAGKYGKGVMIEEGTTNLVYNSDFETVTGTATVFSDPLTNGSAWTTYLGSGTFGGTGWTSTATNSQITAGNGAWKPLNGSGGQNLALTSQATFTTPATLSGSNAMLKFHTDANNSYYMMMTQTAMQLWKKVSGTATQVSSVSFTPTASTTYTITLSLDTTGLLTAKLYSGTGTGGALLQTLTATDTSLTGGFLLGVGGDTGVVVSAASVTGPIPEQWSNIGGSTTKCITAIVPGVSGGNAVRFSASGTGNTGTTRFNGLNSVNIVSGQQYTISYYARRVSGTGTLYIAHDGAGSGRAPFTDTSGNWIRVSQTITATSNSNSFGFYLATAFDVIDIDAVQIEQKAYATSYLRNDSTSASATRNAETLTIPSSVLNASAGAISRWVNVPAIVGTRQLFIFDGNGSANKSAQLYIDTNKQATLVYGTGTTTVTLVSPTALSAGSHRIGFNYSSAGVDLVIDGVKVATNATAPSFAFGANMYEGSRADGTLQLNGYADDLAIFNRVLTDAEAAAIYQSPVTLNDLSQTPNWPALTNKPTTVGGYGITDAVTTTQLGVANGIATLGADGKVTSTQIIPTPKPAELKIPLWVYSGGSASSTSATDYYLQTGTTSVVSSPAGSACQLYTHASGWPAGTTFCFEASIWNSGSGFSGNATLWDVTTGTPTGGQTISIISTTAQIVRSSPVTMTSGKKYGISIYSNSGTVYITNACLVVFMP